MINFLKQIFTWWHKQTIGTFIYTLIKGKYVGKDEFENKYYINSEGKRWVIYKNIIESSKIPPEWHQWIHYMCQNKPPENSTKYSWQKKHEENLTGTSKTYRPEGSLVNNSKKNIKKYDTWNV
jgi:NADH:ubiquinone oxidoreductase subunit